MHTVPTLSEEETLNVPPLPILAPPGGGLYGRKMQPCSLGPLELRGQADVHTAWGGGGRSYKGPWNLAGGWGEQLSLEETLTMSE